MKTPLSGIVPPMVTPLSDSDALDVGGLERLIGHLIVGRVSGLFILGTTGEGPSLSYRLRKELIQRTCKLAAGRVPVLVGISDSAFSESVSLAGIAADAGAEAVVAAPPYYFPLGQPELLDYYQRLLSALPLPLYLYNIPAMTKIVIEPQTLRHLLDSTRIVGFKDSSGDLDYFDQILEIAKSRPDWSVLIGPEQLMAEAVTRGGHGGVNGGANLHPRLYVDLYEAATRRDADRIAELQRQVVQLGHIYQVGRHPSAIIKGVKCALALRGICSDLPAPPFHRFESPEREKITRLLATLAIPF